ncbi:anti-sigma factor [Mucilaginibacter jinjuensis]|uniref:Anti-sigma factor n=1 Tax=Mucilaginibacter jinjuensis TaxID=1176721 RepID=A0ABY7T6B1_9SPHI|nr:anti-sigma factor [Mucilaginibacter jinjuensis]WCT11799.1 anti-sigma factor [Mucilaginibacter jinjuensis]
MEDVKAYMESGILELYVLGDVNQDEKHQVEAMALQHPVIKAELESIEKSMELYAEIYAIEPSEDIRGQVLNSLITNLGDDRSFKPSHSSNQRAKVVELSQQKSVNFFKYAFAACLTLLILSIATLFAVYNKLKSANGQLVTMQLQTQKFSNKVNLMDHQLDIFRDPSFKIIKLDGTAKTPNAKLAVAWSPAKQKVMIDLGRMRLPANDDQHSYQLWALVDGKPVDLGVFNAADDSTGLLEMKSIARAQAFAVTLEQRGGVPSPTMANLVLVGKTE